MRIAILGNSGSGQSTLARRLAERAEWACLDLDTVAREPGQIAVPSAAKAAEDEVRSLCALHEHWVVEGRYADRTSVALTCEPRLLFLNPGEAACLASCRARPRERHTSASREDQDRHLSFLPSQGSDSCVQAGEMSLAAHVACFRSDQGPKTEIGRRPTLEPSSPEPPSWTS